MEKFDVEKVMENIRTEIAQKQLNSGMLSFTTPYYRKMIAYLKSQSEIVIFGAGKYGKTIVEDLRQQGMDTIKCFCDNKAATEPINGIKVLLPKDAVRLYPNACYVIASKFYENEILSQLIHMGVEIDNIRIFNLYSAGLLSIF